MCLWHLHLFDLVQVQRHVDSEIAADATRRSQLVELRQILLLGLQVEDDREARAAAVAVAQVYAAVELGDDLLADDQAKAYAVLVDGALLGLHKTEQFEQLSLIFLTDTDACVNDGDVQVLAALESVRHAKHISLDATTVFLV